MARRIPVLLDPFPRSCGLQNGLLSCRTHRRQSSPAGQAGPVMAHCWLARHNISMWPDRLRWWDLQCIQFRPKQCLVPAARSIRVQIVNVASGADAAGETGAYRSRPRRVFGARSGSFLSMASTACRNIITASYDAADCGNQLPHDRRVSVHTRHVSGQVGVKHHKCEKSVARCKYRRKVDPCGRAPAVPNPTLRQGEDPYRFGAS